MSTGPYFLQAGRRYLVKRHHSFHGGRFCPGEVWDLVSVRTQHAERVFFEELRFARIGQPDQQQTWTRSTPLEPETGSDLFQLLPKDQG